MQRLTPTISLSSVHPWFVVLQTCETSPIPPAPPRKGEFHLLVGQAGGGATTQLAERYAALLAAARQSGRVPRQLWLTPHRLVGEQVRRLLVAAGMDAVLDPGIKTIGRVAEALVSMDAGAPNVLPRPASRWLLEQSIGELYEADKFQVMADVAERSGLVDAVEQMIGELKSRGITAEGFAKWAHGKNQSPRDREIASIYTHYQSELATAHSADRFDLTRLAAGSIDRVAVQDYDLLVIDGFSSFDYYERDLVGKLIDRAGESWLSLPTIDPLERGELTATARRTLEWFATAYPDATTDSCDTPPAPRAGSIEHLVNHVFVPPGSAGAEPPTNTDHVQVIAAADLYQEAVEVARRVKSLLIAGVAPAEIVVATASLESHRRRLDEVFETYGIPASFGTPTVVGDDPAVRALAGVLEMAVEDWPFRGVVSSLTCGLLGALEGRSDEPPWRTARGAAEWLVRELQVAKGRQALMDNARRLATQAAEPPEARSTLQTAAEVAQPLLERLNTACEALPQSASPLEWVAASEQLAAALDLVLEPRPGGAWQAVREAAAWVARMASRDGSKPLPWSLAEWLGQLHEWMSWLVSSTSIDEEGRVRVYGAGTARFATAAHLFVLGLDETSFSTATRSAGLYGDTQYDRMAASSSGRPLPATPPHERTMQLFYDVLRGARESLTFSFAALDSSGQSCPASPLLTEACRTLGERFAAQLDVTPSITSVPPAGVSPRSLRDWRLLAVHQPDEKMPSLLGSLLKSKRAKPASDALAASLVAMHHRVRGDSFGPMEGVLASTAARKWCGDRFGDDHQWSTSQLETYAMCPYKFLLKHVLKIAPLLESALEIDYSRRGSLLHKVFGELHARLNAMAESLPPSAHARDVFDKALDDAIKHARSELSSYGLEAVLDELLASEVEKWAAKYYDQHKKYDQQSHHFDRPLLPTHFELRFGKPNRHADDDEAAASTDAAYELHLDEQTTIKLGGRIDRVDVGQVGETLVFQVIDYKSSSSFTMKPEELNDGRKLQPTLYAMAAAQVLSIGGQEAMPLKTGYWLVRQSGFGKCTQEFYTVEAGEVRPTEHWEEFQPAIRNRVRAIVQGIRHAEFPMYSPDENCTSNCDYCHVCRVSQARSLNKVWPPPVADEAPAEFTETHEPDSQAAN